MLAKTALHYRSLDFYICHDDFGFINKRIREYDDMKEEIKNLKTSIVHQRF